MLETADIGASIGSFLVSDGDFNNFQIQLIGPKNEVEIAKRIKITEEFPVGDESVVIFPENNLGAAKGIFKRLRKQPSKRQAKELIPDNI